jgi:hypothetical protein
MRKKKVLKYYGGHVHHPRCVVKSLGGICHCGIYGKKPIRVPWWVYDDLNLSNYGYIDDMDDRYIEKATRLVRKTQMWRARHGREVLADTDFKLA